MSGSEGASSDGSDVHFDSPSAFWVTKDASGQVMYNWKMEGWELSSSQTGPIVRWQHVHQIIEQPLQPMHSKASRQFQRLNYPALSDEDLGFFYDPSKVDYWSNLKLAVQSKENHPLELTQEEQVWETWNFVQFFCMGCRIQQFRGSFHGDDVALHTGRSEGVWPVEVRPCLTCSRGGQWAFDQREQAPVGPYVATDSFGGWRPARPVDACRYNEVLQNGIKREIQHRHQNEERERSLRDPFHWKHCTQGVPTYQHALVGSWTPKGSRSGQEWLATTLPPLPSDFAAPNPSRSTKSWLALYAERERARAQPRRF